MYIITRSITLKCGEKVNVKLIVKEEDRKVIAIVDSNTCGSWIYLNNLVKKAINKFFEKRGLGVIMFSPDTKISKDLKLGDYYRTIATCDPRDEWNDKTGIKIALDKMKDKLNHMVSKRMALFFEKLNWDIKLFSDKFFG